MGDLAELAIPDSVKGLATHFMPKRLKEAGVDLGDLIDAAQFASKFLGHGNGGAASPSTPMPQGHVVSGAPSHPNYRG